jgi:hypothetical protein
MSANDPVTRAEVAELFRATQLLILKSTKMIYSAVDDRVSEKDGLSDVRAFSEASDALTALVKAVETGNES